ncbi:uncharacterized protein LOC123452527 [Hordeum vulgare subsp. vulgare]|uniref:F-box domain-containing protein n=2 Tax=Hordeum vulgare subsp. vulgare TaxID=112509 RepID=A0A8I6XU01_HORVV|nr:uncharacterized protein LOC123452527 [Hordeum vulgare subsp. vulgare]
MGELTRLRLSSSRPPAPAPAPPEEDDDLLSEILLRLPPLPSSLPRASLVCNRWRGLVSAPAFLRRFRAHHRRRVGGPPPPLLGFFEDALYGVSFTATLDAPDRIPDGRFSRRFDDGGSAPIVLGCRDGLVLILDPTYPLGQIGVLIWDPVTGDQRRLTVPPALDDGYTEIYNGALLRAAAGARGGDHRFQFQLVMVGVDRKHTRAFACVYSSEAGVWGDLISAPLVSMSYHTVVSMSISSTLVGNSLYWSVFGNSAYGILEFDLDTQRLAVIPVPVSSSSSVNWSFWAMPMEDGGLGFLYLLDFSTQLWKRTTDRDGDVSWVLAKTIELDKLLSLDKKKSCPMMLGFSDCNNVVFFLTVTGLVMVQFESMQFKKLAHTRLDLSLVHPHVVHPFSTVYTADMGTGVGDDRAELLDST